ncbi:hypothetical protein EYZ11_008968 [Aspergillus tanneri]|uniref:Uncharacterized protein n=1 Tax=Aspergillus tanneri TaxID=1220188 RepID=A0A4S3J940_9EURO|nr:hypothetical protein EYZ11_008968 [Aspergillus tanneri]
MFLVRQPAMFGFSFKRQREPEELTDVDSGATHEKTMPFVPTYRTERIPEVFLHQSPPKFLPIWLV